MSAVDEFEELPEHEPSWAILDRVTHYRKQLLAAGYAPVVRQRCNRSITRIVCAAR